MLLQNDNYYLFRHDRCDMKRRGGVILIYIINELNSYCLSQCTNTQNEFITISFSHYRLSVVYRSPQSYIVKTSSQINILEEVSNTIYVCIFIGDFNFPGINWSSNQCESLFLDLLSNCSLNKLIKLIIFPTREITYVIYCWDK